MKLTTTRTISALAVTGALVLTGAGAAQAGDHDGHDGARSTHDVAHSVHVPSSVDDAAATFDELTSEQQQLFLKLVGDALSDGVFNQGDLSAVVDQFEEQTGVDLTLA